MQVIAAVIFSADRSSVLLTQRRPDQDHAGCWEFPGGKLEQGESAAQALARELQEELAIQVECAHFMMRFPWHYPHKTVWLEIWQIDAYAGLPTGSEGQTLCWQPLSQLMELDLVAADRGVARALQLPPCYAITPEQVHDIPAFLDQTENLFRRQPVLLQIRFRPSPGEAAQADALARQLFQLAARYRQTVLVNRDIELANAANTGLHLTSHQLTELTQRPIPTAQLLAASIHSLDELDRALKLGVDFVVLSAVNATPSHPDGTILGWPGFAAIADQCPVPVFALGGVGLADMSAARESGAVGVAGIRAFFPQA